MLGHVVPRKLNQEPKPIRRLRLAKLKKISKCRKIEDIYSKIKCLYSELAKIEKKNENFRSDQKYMNLMNELTEAVNIQKAVNAQKAKLSPGESVNCDDNKPIEDRIKCIDEKLDIIKNNDIYYFRNPTYASLLVDRNDLMRTLNSKSSESITHKGINLSQERDDSNLHPEPSYNSNLHSEPSYDSNPEPSPHSMRRLRFNKEGGKNRKTSKMKKSKRVTRKR